MLVRDGFELLHAVDHVLERALRGQFVGAEVENGGGCWRVHGVPPVGGLLASTHISSHAREHSKPYQSVTRRSVDYP